MIRIMMQMNIIALNDSDSDDGNGNRDTYKYIKTCT